METSRFERVVPVPPADLPAEVSTQAGPSQFRSDIFKQTPPNFTSAETSESGSYTEDFKDRLERHKSDHVPATKDRRPVELSFYFAIKPSVQTVAKIVKALGVPMEELVK